MKSKKTSMYKKFLWAIMKMNKVKDQQEGIKMLNYSMKQ